MDYNPQNQNKLTVKTPLKNVEITTNESTEKITFVSKKISVSNNDLKNIVEIILKEAVDDTDKITFLKKTIIKKDPIIEFSPEDFEDKIVCYIKGNVYFNELKKSDTILFEEKIPENSKVILIGFSVFDVLDSENSLYYLLLVLF